MPPPKECHDSFRSRPFRAFATVSARRHMLATLDAAIAANLKELGYG